jgi:hypothetical protein
MGRLDQHKRRKTERERSKAGSARVHDGDTFHSLALHVCLGFLSFLFFTSSNAFRSSMSSDNTYTHRHTHTHTHTQCTSRPLN